MLVTNSPVAVENVSGYLSVNKEGKAMPELGSSFGEGDTFLDGFSSDEVVGDILAVIAAVAHGLEAHGEEVPLVLRQSFFILFHLFLLSQKCQRALLLFSRCLVGLRICIMEGEVKSSFFARKARDGVVEGEVSSI